MGAQGICDWHGDGGVALALPAPAALVSRDGVDGDEDGNTEEHQLVLPEGLNVSHDPMSYNLVLQNCHNAAFFLSTTLLHYNNFVCTTSRMSCRRHNLRHFIEDAIHQLMHNIHWLQWMLDHHINMVHGQYGDLAECVKEHYHNN
jgi:hypothetical protein